MSSPRVSLVAVDRLVGRAGGTKLSPVVVLRGDVDVDVVDEALVCGIVE
jgi:hypothetical protein